MKRVLASFAGVALALTVSTAARADETEKPKATPSNAEMVEAETRFQEGITLYEKGSINEARVKLVQAYAVLGRPNILWNWPSRSSIRVARSTRSGTCASS